MAVDDIGRASVGAAVVGTPSSDDDVVEAIAIDIACGTERHEPQLITGTGALDPEAVIAVEASEIDDGREATRLAEHHEGRADRRCAQPVEILRPDQQIVEAVSIDVAGRRYR